MYADYLEIFGDEQFIFELGLDLMSYADYLEIFGDEQFIFKEQEHYIFYCDFFKIIKFDDLSIVN